MVNFNKVKDQKGVTMVVLVFAILILTIITSTIVYKAINSFDLRRYNKMNEDLNILQQRVASYYSEKGEIPKLMEYENISIPSNKLDQLDNYIYYVIDLDKLGNVKLNYGTDYEKLKTGKSISELKDNLYVINAQTYNIYYVAGVESEGTTYYKLDGSASKIEQLQYVSAPALKDGMTPIAWDEENNEWKQINKYDENWYDYYAESPKWANAQTEDGSMWVWIPRYEYKIDSLSKKIETKFIPVSKTEADEGYEIAQAFRCNYSQGGYDEEVSGMWIAKYETSMETYSGSTWESTVPESASSGNVSTQLNTNVRPVSKVNADSWRYISIENAYLNSLNYNKDLNSHLIKNSEWGAVAYLSYSNYGTNGVEISANTSSYKTGTDLTQSSNANITGVFDLSGGASEFVSAYYKDAEDLTAVHQLVKLQNKHVTVYTEDHLSYLGDAMNETKGWNQDLTNNFDTYNPCLVRGGSCVDTTGTGIFAYNKDKGLAGEGKGYRMVLVDTTKEQESTYTVDNVEIPVPAGFKVSTEDSEHSLAGGVVIKDSQNNEFVWVPCTVEDYLKSYNSGINFTDSNLYDDKNSEGTKIKELAQISKYGGFYVSRYEAGAPENRYDGKNEVNTPVSKNGAKVWTNISYSNAQKSAEQMYAGETYKSGLITGTEWDVITKRLYDSTDKYLTEWGNYSDSTDGGSLQVSGSNPNWKITNIYDFGGNTWEWTEEAYTNNERISRGGSFKNSSTNFPIEYRRSLDQNNTGSDLGFRIVLYLDSTVELDTVSTPEVKDGMIPVKWNGSNWVICSKNDNDWYEYKDQISGTDGLSKWANVMLSDGKYKQGQNDTVGTIISAQDLGSMFVWIPRYEYKIDSVNQTIDVKFIPKTQTFVDSDYTYIHPAFRDGSRNNYKNGEWDQEISGFWISKYAAGFQANTVDSSNDSLPINSSDEVKYSNKTYTSNNNDCTINALSQDLSTSGYTNSRISYPVFKALTYSYNGISTGDMFTISKEVAGASDFYGLNEYNVDSHLIKNSEWGAVAYLAHSSYGRNGIEVTVNTKNLDNVNSKNVYTVTGYANNTALGTDASTTNNMTGVFDLNGCIWERTSAYITNASSSITNYGDSYAIKDSLGVSNGYEMNSNKYVTLYPYASGDDNLGNLSEYDRVKSDTYGYGDAVLETSSKDSVTSSWNGDYSSYPANDYPFFIRGGYYNDNTKAGIFAFGHTNGISSAFDGFRTVLIGM